jgi:hydroxypyruvate isomerase
MPRFSANLGFLWLELPLLERISAAADAGFGAIELHWPYDTDPRAVADLCQARGLTLVGINSPFGDPARSEFGLGALPGREAEFRASMETAIAWARAAGAGAIHVISGTIDPDDRPAATRTFAANLAWAAEAAGDLTLLLEPMNPRDRPNYFTARVDPTLELIAEVGAPTLKLMFDAYHVGVGEGDVIGRLTRALPQIAHIQIAAVPSRAEPDEGTLDYADFFATLDRLGYTGWVGAEYRPRTTTAAGLGWMQRLVA